MPINASIPLMVGQGRQRRDPARQMANALAVRREIGAEQSATTRRNALAGAVGAGGELDLGAASKALAATGDVEGALDVRKMAQSEKASAAEAELKGLELRRAKFTSALQQLGMVHANGGAGYEGWFAQVQADLPDLAGSVPPTYDPEATPGILQQGMSVAEQFGAQMEQARLKVSQGTLDERTRHNREMEARPTGPLVVNQAGEKEEHKAEGKRLVNQATAVFDEGESARRELENMQIAKGIPVTTGAVEPFKMKLAALAQGLGVSESQLASMGFQNATSGQAFQGIMQNVVLTKLQAQKGPQTENDAKRIESTVANLGQTPEASAFLLDVGIELRSRDVERAEFWETHRGSTGSYRGASKAWREHMRGMPIVGVNATSGLPVLYGQWREVVARDNPEATPEQIRAFWRQKYGGG